MQNEIDSRRYDENGLVIMPPPEPLDDDRTQYEDEEGEWQLHSTTSFPWGRYKSKTVLGYGRHTHDRWMDYYEFAIWCIPEDKDDEPYWLIEDILD